MDSLSPTPHTHTHTHTQTHTPAPFLSTQSPYTPTSSVSFPSSCQGLSIFKWVSLSFPLFSTFWTLWLSNCPSLSSFRYVYLALSLPALSSSIPMSLSHCGVRDDSSSFCPLARKSVHTRPHNLRLIPILITYELVGSSLHHITNPPTRQTNTHTHTNTLLQSVYQ